LHKLYQGFFLKDTIHQNCHCRALVNPRSENLGLTERQLIYLRALATLADL